MSDDTGKQQESEGMKNLRESRDSAIAERDEARAELREFKATTMFTGNGLTEKHAELFLKTNPEADITPDVVKTFADEYGLAVQAQEGGQEPPPEAKKENPDSGAAALAGAAGSSTAGSTPAEQAKISRADYEKLLESNPSEAAKLFVEGRVETHPLNVQARQLRDRGIIQ